jgi:small conductance mechanosensitive channel
MLEPFVFSQWLSTLSGKIVLIAFIFLLALIVLRLSRPIANYVLKATRLTSRQPNMRPERKETLLGLIAGAISFAALTAAMLASLSLFVDTNTLIWVVGLFSAAFGLGARPVVSDFLSGVGFIFEDTFDVSEKVEFPGLAGGSIMGIVEAVNLRTTVIRSTSGESYIVPNGEIRVVRNFSRGLFSTANIKVKLATADLGRVIPLLEELGYEAVGLLPNLLEPWQVISETGEMGQQTELTLIAKARFGMAGEMRPKMLDLIHERMADAGIDLAS